MRTLLQYLLHIFVLVGVYCGVSAGLTSAVGKQPASVTVADFNWDGAQDIAVANSGSNNITVLLGNGDGTFQPPHNFNAGIAPVSVATGDFNEDGVLDLVVVNKGSNNVSLLLGNGDGTFQPPVNFPVGALPISVAVGDFDGDGTPDIAVANSGSNNVSVLLGNGDGTFETAASLATGLKPSSVTTDYLDGDGNLDLVVTNSIGLPGTVSVFLGNGNGTFQSPTQFDVGLGPQSVIVADCNGDGIMDLVIGYDSDADGVSLLPGKGDGTFKPAEFVRAGTGELPLSVAVGDFDDDGVLDLAVTNAGNGNGHEFSGISVVLGDGGGTFAPPSIIEVGLRPVFVTTGDFNGDGSPDLVVANWNSNDITVLFSNRDGTFHP